MNKRCRLNSRDTLSVLSSWQIFDAGDLLRRLQWATPQDRALVESHLCRFDRRVFDAIGKDLRLTLLAPEHRSPFLSYSFQVD